MANPHNEKPPELQWSRTYDENYYPIEEASSPYHNDGSSILWRLRWVGIPNGYWLEDHDKELLTEEPKIYYLLEIAKEDIARKHFQILVEEGLA